MFCISISGFFFKNFFEFGDGWFGTCLLTFKYFLYLTVQLELISLNN